NGDGFPDLAVAAGPGVTVLINAADWGGGPAPSPPHRVTLHQPLPSRPQMEPIAALLAASKLQAEHILFLTLPDLPPSPVRQWLLETATGQPAHRDATSTPRLL